MINFGENQMTRIAGLLMIVAIALAEVACVSAQSSGGAAASTACDGTGVCKVDVSVTQCFVTVNPSTLHVRAKNIDIFWEITSDSYRFSEADGIKLKQDDPDFDQPQSQSNGKKFKLHDKNDQAKPGQSISYPYNVKVQRLVGTQWVNCGTFDPIIVNEGS